MEFNPELLIYAAIVVATVVLLQGIYLVAFGQSVRLDKRVNRRLDLLEKTNDREAVMEQLRKEMNQHLRAKKLPIYSILAEKAQRGGIAFSPTQLVMVMILLTVFVYVALTMGTQSAQGLRLILAPLIGCGTVYFWVNSKAKKRMALIEEQLPDAVELMVRSLKVGHPFNSAIQIVSREIADPLGTEIGMIADEAQYGRDIGEALSDMAERMDMQDMRFLAVAVKIQQQSGGNLADILTGLANVVRLRFKLFRRVKAITAEARFSGWFLSAFPFVATLAIQLLDPDYFDGVTELPIFIPAVLVVVAMVTVNIFVMKALTNIKV